MTGSVVFVIGVSGCGKSTVARALADEANGDFLEGDDFHPPENIRAMSAAQPLTDDMRWGWLSDIGTAARERSAQGKFVAVACSGLKSVYRDVLRQKVGNCRMILLSGDKSLIRARMEARENHYMPPGLLDSQFDDLELPGPLETDVFPVSIDDKPDAVIASARAIAFYGE